MDTSSTFPLYDETATITSSQKVKGGAFFDIGGAFRVWGKNLLAGVTYSHTSSDADVALDRPASPTPSSSTVPGPCRRPRGARSTPRTTSTST